MSEVSVYGALTERVGRSVAVRPEGEGEGEGWELVELSELRSQGEIGGAECFEFNALFRAPEPRPQGCYVIEFAAGSHSPTLFFNPVASRWGYGVMQLAVSSAEAVLVGVPGAAG